MKKMFVSLVASGLAAFTVNAEVVDMNGTFEKCAPAANGVILPEGWLINKGSSKKSEIQITKEKDEVRNGNFALLIENEDGGSAFLMKWQKVAVSRGDKVKITMWVKGSGSVAGGFIANGIPEGSAKEAFLGTSAWPLNKVNSPEKWVEVSNVYEIKEFKQGDKVCSGITLIPVIYAEKKGELCVDDFSFEVIRAEKK